jgi:Kae1-associated kinase Bud32
MHKTIIQRGAEAVLYLSKEDGREFLVKERVVKGYRVPELDRKIRSQRARREHNIMEKARAAGLDVPRTSLSDGCTIRMDYVRGERLKDVFNGMKPVERERTCEKIGLAVAKLHSAGIMHGDLTTSNMIMSGDRLFLIDFGLAKLSNKAEDHAVDLFLLYEAIKSTHFSHLEEAWKTVIKAYVHNYVNSEAVLERMEGIKKRRRYK